MVKKFLTAAIATVMAQGLAGAASAAGDAKAGEQVFRKCVVCHDVRPGKHKIGPSLAGIVGTKAGSAKGYRFSPATEKSGIVWTEENLDKYLANPRKLISGTRMAFAGLSSKKERDDVIAYLKTLK